LRVVLYGQGQLPEYDAMDWAIIAFLIFASSIELVSLARAGVARASEAVSIRASFRMALTPQFLL
jgi:hypothetical protein